MRTRRQFIADTLLAAAATSLPATRAQLPISINATPNNRLNMALVGAGGRGVGHLPSLLSLGDVDVSAICDVDDEHANAAARAVEQKTGRRPKTYRDYRKLLEDKSIDAVSIAMPNHWHALAAHWAMQAGKDAYVEKPISHCVWEGRKLIDTARATGRVLTQGSQRRSWPSHIAGIAYLHSGALGKLQRVHGVCYKPRASIGKTAAEAVPANVDYDLWLGPARKRPFSKNRFHYNWHWHWDTGDGDLGNTGVHDMDIIVWATQRKELPRQVVSIGGRFGYNGDDGETPNTQIVGLDYGDLKISYEVRNLTSDPHLNVRIGCLFHCERGYLAATLDGVAAFDRDGKKIKDFGGRAGDEAHFRNFADAAKARDPKAVRVSPLEAHLGSSFCHLPNISYRLGEQIPFDTNDPFEGYDLSAETFANFRQHLEKNGIDTKKTTYTRGRVLTFDPIAEKFIGHKDANNLLRVAHRKPFAFSKEA